MSSRAARGRTVVVGAALILLGSGCHSTVGVSQGQSPAASFSPGVGATGAATGGTGAPVTGGSDNNLVTLDGKARSVETTGSVGGLSSVHLTGSSVLTATGDVIDHSGRDLGTGSLRAQGTDLVVSASALQIASRMQIQPAQVTVNIAGQASLTLGLQSSATVASARLTFQPPPPPPKTMPVPLAGSPTTVAVTTTVPPPVPVTGPVTLRATALQVTGTSLRWTDAPADLVVASSEADLSWAGSGSITTAQGPLQATFLGVRAQQLHATVHRSGADVGVHGTGLALQAYADGVPQLRTVARIDILSTGATTGFLGKHHAFVWTPRNLGNTYDMAILSIHPANGAAGGIYLGLLPMPPMFGGEPHALVGGDTAGLKGGVAIDSLIARHGDDKRSIGYDAPTGVPLVLIVQGNFDPITVTLTSA